MENKISKEKRQEYNKRFFEKNKEYIDCEVCGGKYKYYGKANHMKTKVHLVAMRIKNEML